MKKIFLLAALACSVMFADAQNLIVGSYNIRNDNRGDADRGLHPLWRDQAPDCII